MGINKGKTKGIGLIFDSKGYPQIDNPQALPKDVWDTLTEEQKNVANSRVSASLRRYD